MTTSRGLALALALVAAIGLGMQLTMFVELHGPTLGLSRWLGFFTVWSNLLAVGVGTAMAMEGKASLLAAPRVRLVLVSALAAIWLGYAQLIHADPGERGLQRLVGILLHDATPPLAAALWLAAPHGGLSWRDLVPVVAFPAVFLLVAQLRGRADGWYPYDFLDPASGSPLVAFATILLLIGALGAGLILIDRKLADD